MRRIAVLGATGSIGTQALDIVRRHPDRFYVWALTAHSDAGKLFELVREFRPEVAALAVEPDQLPEDIRFCDWVFGEDSSARVAAMARGGDVLTAIVGIAGLPAAMAAIGSAERLLLANKEALVTGGELVMRAARQRGVPILPVDSEHSAIFQCLQAANGNRLERIILTASGGPLRTWNQSEIEAAKVSDVLAHPTWRMGPKITVDCATMMNKGLEVIEAHHLFSMPLEKIEVAVHPQSVVHSMVEFQDGAVLAQLGEPDMRGPIGYAMGYPERMEYGGGRLNFRDHMALTFDAPDLVRFPCLRLAYSAQRAGGAMPVALNAANEAAVGAFLAGALSFGGIARVVEQVLEATPASGILDIEDVYQADREARRRAADIIGRTARQER